MLKPCKALAGTRNSVSCPSLTCNQRSPSQIILISRRSACAPITALQPARETQQQQHYSPSSSAPRPFLALVAASTAAVALLLSPQSALAQTYGYLPGFGPEYQQPEVSIPTPRQQAREEEDRYDEYLLTAEVKEFMALVQQSDAPSEKTLAAARLKLGLRRAGSGQVSVRDFDGEWYNVKPDSQAPGVLMLQNSSGYIFLLPRDPGDRLVQLDLSDDLVVAQLFSNLSWVDLLQPINYIDADSGNQEPLIMTNAQFRGTEDFELVAKSA